MKTKDKKTRESIETSSKTDERRTNKRRNKVS